MAGAGGPAVEITFFGSAADPFASGRARGVAAAGCQRFENGVEMLDDVFLAANHLAVAALESPDAAAGAHINVMEALVGEFLGAANVIDVIGIAAVDDDVVAFELAGEIVQRGVDDSGGNHEPNGAWLRELLHQIVERRWA